MNKDLSAYVKIYQDWIDKETCDKTIVELQNAEWQKHFFYDSSEDSRISLSGDKELDVCFGHVSTYDVLMRRIWDGYNQYIVKDFDFSWYSGWDGFSGPRFNRYMSGQTMANHCDHIKSLFSGDRKGIPILTALGLLNDEYEGGEFVMWDEIIPLKRGDLIIFPSVFLYPHKVNPVLSGIRYSYVSWSW